VARFGQQPLTIRGWTLAYLQSHACVGGNNCEATPLGRLD